MCNCSIPQISSSEHQQLFPSQAELLKAGFLDSHDHWLICAPTGSGKTRMGEWAIERELASGFRTAYVAPLRAIIDERLVDWQLKYKEVGVGAFTQASKLRLQATTNGERRGKGERHE